MLCRDRDGNHAGMEEGGESDDEDGHDGSGSVDFPVPVFTGSAGNTEVSSLGCGPSVHVPCA